MTIPSYTRAVLLLILCTFFWGSSFPVGKHILTEVHAYSMVLWRFVIAALCLLIYVKVARIAWPKNLTTQQWLYVVIVSIIGVGGLNLALFSGLTYTSSTDGALIMALSPLFTSLIASLFHRTIPSMSQFISLAISLLGVLLVITNGHLSLLLGLQINYGDKLIFCGMLAWSLYTFFTQGISKWMPLIPYTPVGMISGASVIGLVCLFSPNIHPWHEVIHSSSSVFYGVMYIGMFATVAGYLLWINGVKQLGSAKASLFFNFVPVFAVLVSFLFGQPVTLLQVVGMVVVIFGLVLPNLWSSLIFKTKKAYPACKVTK